MYPLAHRKHLSADSDALEHVGPRKLRVHDLRATFVLSLANGKTETWVADRTVHRSSRMTNRYRRAARSATELDLGALLPLDVAIPELRRGEAGDQTADHPIITRKWQERRHRHCLRACQHWFGGGDRNVAFHARRRRSSSWRSSTSTATALFNRAPPWERSRRAPALAKRLCSMVATRSQVRQRGGCAARIRAGSRYRRHLRRSSHRVARYTAHFHSVLALGLAPAAAYHRAMPLSELRVNGYRAFSRRTTLQLRPLTLLFGHNSAGKSALLRALPFVGASMRSPRGVPLALSSDAARGASFGEIRSKLPGVKDLELGLSWVGAATNVSPLAGSSSLAVDYKLFELASRRRILVEEFTARRDGGEPLSCTLELGDSEEDQSRTSYNLGGQPVELEFHGLVPHQLTGSHPELALLRSELPGLADSVGWLGAVRVAPERAQTLRNPERRVDSAGNGATEILAYDKLDGGEMVADVSTWYQTATNHLLEVKQMAAALDERFSLRLRRAGSAFDVDISDTGEGMAQVLPVVLLAAMARRGRLGPEPLLCIEQPELHLHPRVHQDITRLFTELVRGLPDVRVVLETHAENLLLSVQLAVARGEIRPDQVAIHWVTQDQSGESSARLVELDGDGYAKNDDWPIGVFEEDVKLARSLAGVRRRS
jgi:AAA ATPase domain